MGRRSFSHFYTVGRRHAPRTRFGILIGIDGRDTFSLRQLAMAAARALWAPVTAARRLGYYLKDKSKFCPALRVAWVTMISIIDDDRSVRESVKSLVRSPGYDAATFASAEEYLGSDCVRNSKCVITDLQMPGMNGVDLRDRLIADGYRKPIIFMSALPAEQVPLRAKAAGAFGFMRKPFSDERLIQCLDKALKGEDARSPGCS
jgi:CheY-like chemotaxis protein